MLHSERGEGRTDRFLGAGGLGSKFFGEIRQEADEERAVRGRLARDRGHFGHGPW